MFFILYLGHAATIFCFLRLPPARSSGLSVTHADAGLWLHSAECGTLSKCLHEDGHETFCSFLIHGNTHFGMSVGHCEGGERKICVFSCCWFFFFYYCAQSERELAWAVFEGWPQHKASGWGPPSERLPCQFFSRPHRSIAPHLHWFSGADCMWILSRRLCLCIPLPSLWALWSSWKGQTSSLDQNGKICIWHSEGILCGCWWGEKQKCLLHESVNKTCAPTACLSIWPSQLFAEFPLEGHKWNYGTKRRWNALLLKFMMWYLHFSTTHAHPEPRSQEFFFKPFAV